MRAPPVWMLREDIYSLYTIGQFLLKDEMLGVLNTDELTIAAHSLAIARGGSDPALPLPQGFPVPRLGLPIGGFAPDYFSFGTYYFCSQRFRNVLSQPEAVVQYYPIQLTSGGAEARARDYRWFRVLASQPAMDMQLSNYEIEEITSQISGRTISVVRDIDQFVLPKDFAAVTDIFRIAETRVDIMVADALAERMLRAGCTGMEFCHPEDKRWGEHVVHFRTSDGIGERRVGFLD